MMQVAFRGCGCFDDSSYSTCEVLGKSLVPRIMVAIFFFDVSDRCEVLFQTGFGTLEK